MKEKQAVMSSNSNRIEWIDAAKALAIVLMIIGHTVEFGTFTRNLIFFVPYANLCGALGLHI